MASLSELFAGVQDWRQGNRAWLTGQEEKLGELLRYYGGPASQNGLGTFLAEMSPIESVDRSMTAGREMTSPDRTPMQRVESLGDMLTGVAEVAAPMAGVRMAGTTADDAARALQETLTGISATPQAVAGREFVADQAGSLGKVSPAQEIADYLARGDADKVTDDMLGALGPNDNAELWRLYESGATGADMPMDTPSRMQRAAEMGFDTGTPLYHGTGADFQAFDAGRFQQSDFGTGGAGIYSSGDAGLAGAYSDLVTRPSGDGANVLPIFTRRFDAFDNGGYRNINNAEQAREYSRRMQEMGVDNVYYTDNMTGEIVENTTFDPSNIRSRFARFDPRLKHLANLSASAAPIGLGALLGMQQDPTLAETISF